MKPTKLSKDLKECTKDIQLVANVSVVVTHQALQRVAATIATQLYNHEIRLCYCITTTGPSIDCWRCGGLGFRPDQRRDQRKETETMDEQEWRSDPRQD